MATDDNQDRIETKRPYPITYEKVMELHSRLDLIAQELKGLIPLLGTVSSLERRLTIQETSVSASTLMKMQDRLHELELSDARQSQSGSTWKEALMWLNTGLLLLLGVATLWLAIHPHA